MAKNIKSIKTIEDVLFSLPKHEQVIMMRLRALIMECIPNALEKISYNVPFYRHRRMIFFIWPPSIKWGPKKEWNDKEEKGVVLGFCQGNLMGNENNTLLREGRKQVYCMYFKSLKEIDEDIIKPLLFEAGLIDAAFNKKTIS